MTSTESRASPSSVVPTPTTAPTVKKSTMDWSKFPRRGYVTQPTPIEKLDNLTQALSKDTTNDSNNTNDAVTTTVYVKRDDLLPGCLGGNKTRKLDFTLADALLKKATAVVTCGAVQSNHCRLTAAWCAKEQLDCHLVLEERVPGTYHEDASGNHFLFQTLLGAKSIRVVPGGTDMMAEMKKTAEELTKQNQVPYIVPGGASNALGALGYANCAQELVEQCIEQKLDLDYVVVPSGSAGTHAGFLAGLSYLGELNRFQVLGINTSRPKDAQEAKVYQLACETAALLALGNTGETTEGSSIVPRDCVRCFDQYVGPGYSLPTEGMMEAVKLFARTEAILLDPVYTGKEAAGMLDLIRNHDEVIPPGSKVLFLHTGGSPALFEYMQYFR